MERCGRGGIGRRNRSGIGWREIAMGGSNPPARTKPVFIDSCVTGVQGGSTIRNRGLSAPLHRILNTNWLPISQPFAFGSANRQSRSFTVCSFPGVIPEIEFREIPSQMLLAPMVVDSSDSTFQDTEESLRRIRVNAPASRLANIFPLAMSNTVMRGKILPNETVRLEVVSHDPGLRFNMFTHDCPKVIGSHPVNLK